MHTHDINADKILRTDYRAIHMAFGREINDQVKLALFEQGFQFFIADVAANEKSSAWSAYFFEFTMSERFSGLPAYVNKS